jgi:phosphatidylglycerol:prolipoprotein diacylglycerol transferase
VDPVLTLVELGGQVRPIGGYGVMLALAMLAGSFIAVRAGARAGLDVGTLIAASGFVTGFGLAGGFLLFVVVELARGVPLSAILAHGGGLVFYGAPLGGALGLFFACRMLGLPLGRLVDVAIPSVPIAHALGRFGCFLGGCCFGAPWDGPLAVLYTHPLAPGAHPSVLRHPAPLYEALGLLFIAAAFMLIPPKQVGTGRRALHYVLAYGALRFVVEGFRGDEVRGLLFGGALSTSQLLSLVFAGLAAAWLFARRGRAEATVSA